MNRPCIARLAALACLFSALSLTSHVPAQETGIGPFGPEPGPEQIGALQGQLDAAQTGQPQQQEPAVDPMIIEPVGQAPPVINFEPYIHEVHRQIRDHWKPVATDDYRYCRIVAWFEVDKSGRISNLRVTDPCDDDRQNEAALAAIRYAAPFTPLPAEYPGQFIEMQYMFYSTPTSRPPGGSSTQQASHRKDEEEEGKEEERRQRGTTSRYIGVPLPVFGFWF